MRVGNYSVLVTPGQERSSGHVALPHGSVYSLRLLSHDFNRPCDAVVYVDGKSVGGFRIPAGASVTLERPAHDTGRFTFYRADSAEGEAVGAANVSRDDRGLIRVEFRPGRLWFPPRPATPVPTSYRHLGGEVRVRSMNTVPCRQSVPTSYGDATENTCGFAPGVTGLSGHSGQRFVEAPVIDYDLGEEVVITVRLVAADDQPRPLTAAPPATRANPVPEPAG